MKGAFAEETRDVLIGCYCRELMNRCHDVCMDAKRHIYIYLYECDTADEYDIPSHIYTCDGDTPYIYIYECDTPYIHIFECDTTYLGKKLS